MRLPVDHQLFRILRMTWVLPLLPARLIVEGINLIEAECVQLVAEFPRLNNFVIYLRRQWAPLSAVVSVYGSSVRTNALAEALNGQLQQRLGGRHPPICRFLGKHVPSAWENNIRNIMIVLQRIAEQLLHFSKSISFLIFDIGSNKVYFHFQPI